MLFPSSVCAISVSPDFQCLALKMTRLIILFRSPFESMTLVTFSTPRSMVLPFDPLLFARVNSECRTDSLTCMGCADVK